MNHISDSPISLYDGDHEAYAFASFTHLLIYVVKTCYTILLLIIFKIKGHINLLPGPESCL